MPGESNNTIGDYTTEELQSLSADQLMAAQQRGFRKPLVSTPGAPAEERPAAAGVRVASPFPSVVTQPAEVLQDAGNVWSAKASGEEFVVPSGQRCHLNPLQLERLLMEGILDQVTRLDGLAQALVNQAQGLPPEKQEMPSPEEFSMLLTLINKVTVMAVASPPVFADDDPTAPDGAIRTSDINLMDRVAILEQALKGVKGLDNFRHAG